MATVLSVDEVYGMAIEIERNGAKFYRKASKQTRDLGVREELLNLAAMEDGHERTFTAMRNGLTEAERATGVTDADDESAMYLREAARGKVFAADPSARLTGQESIQQALLTAIGLEKDSIVFYTAMKGMVSARTTTGIDEIISEEMGHIRMLTGWLQKVEGQV